MKIHDLSVINKIGKYFAKYLSLLIANQRASELSLLIEAYWAILLGKGSGTRWGLKSEINAIKRIIKKPSPIIFDVGANNGDWSFLMHKNYPQSQLYLFEPQPACRKIIESKNIPNSVLITKAVSSKSKCSVKLFTIGQGEGIASLHQRRDSYFQHHKFNTIMVDTISIDEFIIDNKIELIDFMKIDTEGHDLEVLIGAKESLSRGVIKALSFEFGSGNINSRTYFHDFWDLLYPLGFEIYRILPSSQLMPIREYYEDCEYFRGVSNYIALFRQR